MYATKRYKKKVEQLRRERMNEAICENRSRDFFNEMKKLNPKASIASCIDGHVETIDIAEYLVGKYYDIYNSVPSDDDNMQRVKDYISEQCCQSEEGDHVVTQADIAEAIQHLNANKSDGDVGLMSDHLLLSSENFQMHLGLLITAILTHGYQPQIILLATIASIPKDNRGNICDGKNYRGVTICSSISKLMDILLIIRYKGKLQTCEMQFAFILLIIQYKDKLQTSEMQFAFKEKRSTVMCSLVVKEVVFYYVNNNSDVYSCCVDVNKAFDRVCHDKLFQILIDRKMPAIALRSVLDMYQRQCMRTVWKAKFSRQFGTSNGIRQGGIVSPMLFGIYMDVLLDKLQSEGYGCWIGNHYYGSIGYADDLKLLSPSIHGLVR